MRKWLTIACALVALLIAGSAAAQETRGTISGTVRDKDGVLPGANVTITNTGTNVSQQLVTNGSGYFEAPLLIAGAYEVSVELPNFKGFRQTGIQVAVGQSVSLTITLDVGNVSERVDVVAAAVLLDTNAVSSGLSFENRLITELPTFSSMPMLLIRNVSGVAASAAPQFATQGFVGGPSSQAGPIGGVGAAEYTIDGATNAGNARNIATSPNSDMLQEMRIETSNFDASVGHGTGLGVAMMTKAGTNRWSGTGRLPDVDEPPERREPLSEAHSRRRSRVEESIPVRQVHEHVVHPRRSHRDPETGGRTEQAVLLRQLFIRRRSHPREHPGRRHHDSDRSPPERRLLRSPAAAESAAVPHLRSADGAARPEPARPDHP